jgi:hypothetical protein
MVWLSKRAGDLPRPLYSSMLSGRAWTSPRASLPPVLQLVKALGGGWYVGLKSLVKKSGSLDKQPPGLSPEIYRPSVPAGLKTRSPGLKSGATHPSTAQSFPAYTLLHARTGRGPLCHCANNQGQTIADKHTSDQDVRVIAPGEHCKTKRDGDGISFVQES